MSYDLMVFEPTAAPLSHVQSMIWYEQLTQWAEGHSYNDPAVSTTKHQGWFLDIIQCFPPMNGQLSQDDPPEDEASATDYSVGKSAIYCAFAWTKEEQAYDEMFELAQKHGVGFFDVSSENEEVWLPESGRLTLAHSK